MVERLEWDKYDGMNAAPEGEFVTFKDYDALAAENARLVAANKARDEFLRGHRYKHSEVDQYIDLCESQMAALKARLAEAEGLLQEVRTTVRLTDLYNGGADENGLWTLPDRIDAFLASPATSFSLPREPGALAPSESPVG